MNLFLIIILVLVTFGFCAVAAPSISDDFSGKKSPKVIFKQNRLVGGVLNAGRTSRSIYW